MCPNHPRHVTVASYTSYHRSVHADDTLAAPGVFKSLWGLLLLASPQSSLCRALETLLDRSCRCFFTWGRDTVSEGQQGKSAIS